MTSRAGRAAVWLLTLLVAGVALRAASTGDLAAPPLGSLHGLTGWAEAREPAATSIAVARLVAEVAVWYVLAISALHAASGALRVAGGHRLADALALPAVRRTVRAGLGLGLAAASSIGGRDHVSGPGVATMTPVDATDTTETGAHARGGTATMRPQVLDGTSSGVARTAPTPATWTVAPGESLWSIAEELLADAWRRPPADGEIDPFWRSLVERNRGRLVDQADPDLIHPGQVLEVPPLPSPPT